MATREIAAANSNIRVVALTTFDTYDLIFDAIRAGAQAYRLKDASEAELLETARAVYPGESRVSPTIAHKVLKALRATPAPKRKTATKH